jgi:superfamily II DNA or RNA helicase
MNKKTLNQKLSEISLRPWQAEHSRKALEHLKKSDIYVVEVVTGGGKTTFACYLAAVLYRDGVIDEVAIACPSIGIKDAWAEDMQQFGFVCTSRYYDTAGQDAYAFTYAGAENEDVQNKLAYPRKRLLITDEFHHAERDRTWGDSLKRLVDSSTKTIFLSGTPWKTEGTIAVLEEKGYYRNGFVEADTVYRYGEDLLQTGSDRATVYADFKFFNSKVKDLSTGEETIFDAPDPDDVETWERLSDENCYLPLGPHVQVNDSRISKNSMVRSLLQDALLGLGLAKQETRQRAMMLVVCRNIKEARCACDYLSAQGVGCEVIVSDDEKAADRLKELKRQKPSQRPDVVVSVGMVSEGVNIPDLKVLAYLSPIMSLLYLIQVIGRVLRRMPTSDGYLDKAPGQTPARIYMPAHPRLLWLGLEFEKDKRNAMRNSGEGGDGPEGPEREEKDYENSGGDAVAELRGGQAMPSDMTRMYRLLREDSEACLVVNDLYSSWIYELCRAGHKDKAREELLRKVEEFDIDMGAGDQFLDQLDYDTRLALVRKDAQRISGLIRFSHPSFKHRTDDKVFQDVRTTINRLAGLPRVKSAFNKATLEQKEHWCDVANKFYEEGRRNG